MHHTRAAPSSTRQHLEQDVPRALAYTPRVSSRIARVTAPSVIALGSIIAATAIVRARAAPLPLTLTLVGVGLLLGVLGIGIWRRARTAWAFTVALLGVLVVAGLLALPALVNGGVPSAAAGVTLALVGGTLIFLAMGHEEFE